MSKCATVKVTYTIMQRQQTGVTMIRKKNEKDTSLYQYNYVDNSEELVVNITQMLQKQSLRIKGIREKQGLRIKGIREKFKF